MELRFPASQWEMSSVDGGHSFLAQQASPKVSVRAHWLCCLSAAALPVLGPERRDKTPRSKFQWKAPNTLPFAPSGRKVQAGVKAQGEAGVLLSWQRALAACAIPPASFVPVCASCSASSLAPGIGNLSSTATLTGSPRKKKRIFYSLIFF